MQRCLDGIFKIVGLTNRLRQVERTINAVGLKRLENDSEHSFQLALLSWYLIESENLSLNKELAIRYCLIHDLVEAYTGDVDPHTSTRTDKESKKAKENFALKVIKESLQECPSIAELICRYEAKLDPESKFVYALDKMQPILNVLQDSGDYYHKYGITFEKWLNYNKEKVALSPETSIYFDQLLEFLEDQKGLFATG
jgi:putative hydrolase of HD superfamily